MRYSCPRVGLWTVDAAVEMQEVMPSIQNLKIYSGKVGKDGKPLQSLNLQIDEALRQGREVHVANLSRFGNDYVRRGENVSYYPALGLAGVSASALVDDKRGGPWRERGLASGLMRALVMHEMHDNDYGRALREAGKDMNPIDVLNEHVEPGSELYEVQRRASIAQISEYIKKTSEKVAIGLLEASKMGVLQDTVQGTSLMMLGTYKEKSDVAFRTGQLLPTLMRSHVTEMLAKIIDH